LQIGSESISGENLIKVTSFSLNNRQ